MTLKEKAPTSGQDDQPPPSNFLGFLNSFIQFKPSTYRGWEGQRDERQLKQKLDVQPIKNDEGNETGEVTSKKLEDMRNDFAKEFGKDLVDGPLGKIRMEVEAVSLSFGHVSRQLDRSSFNNDDKKKEKGDDAKQKIADQVINLDTIVNKLESDFLSIVKNMDQNTNPEEGLDEKTLLLESKFRTEIGIRLDGLQKSIRFEKDRLIGREKTTDYPEKIDGTVGEIYNPKKQVYEIVSKEELERLKSRKDIVQTPNEAWGDIPKIQETLKGAKEELKKMKEAKEDTSRQDELISRLNQQLEELLEEQKDFNTKMTKVEFGGASVFITKGDQQQVELAKKQLETERNALAKLRGQMTDSMNDRMKKKPGSDEFEHPAAAKQVLANCDMAEKLTNILDVDPNLLKGILARLESDVIDQGAYKKEDFTPEKIKENILQSAKNLKDGKGEPGDGNKITSFIANFIDGLTEVNEGKHGETFDKIWPAFKDAMGLQDEDKERLMERIDYYKKMAGGTADTESGKGNRKLPSRSGFKPMSGYGDTLDDDALIKNDLSGSVHSQLLAQEIAESLSRPPEETVMESGEPKLDKTGKPMKFKTARIKNAQDPVRITDPALLNARALDALLLTGGGKKSEQEDLVFHTAWEMLNGMREITGCPLVNQAQATKIMELLGDGNTFTDAMEAIFPPGEQTKLPWRDGL